MSGTPKITKLPKPIRSPVRLNLGGGTSSLQKMRPPSQGRIKKSDLYFYLWVSEEVQEFLFKKMPTTVYISRRFVKKMLIIGISEVCRKRLCFPEEEFIIRIAGDMKVKVLNPFQDSAKNESVTLMKKWIRKIFEWTEKGWIEKVAIIIGAEVSRNQLNCQ